MKLEYEVTDTKNMIDELYQHLQNNPGFTGTIQLYGSLRSKTIDRYYAIGYCKNGMFHREDDYAILVNYKDTQYIEYYFEGNYLFSDLYNYFDTMCE